MKMLITPEDTADLKYGVSLNQEDYHVQDSMEDAIFWAFEELRNWISIDPGGEETIPIWVGPALQYNAAYFLYEAMTEWGGYEDRVEELFYDNSMFDGDNPVIWPTGYEKTLLYQFIKEMVQRMVDEFNISINYYEIAMPVEYKVFCWWPPEDDEPHFRIDEIDGAESD